MNVRSILFLLLGGSIWTIGVKTDGFGCMSPQYLTIGTNEVINCSFRKGFYSLLWYNSPDIFHSEAILTITNSVKSGPGFLLREFDIHPNGSLIVHNVTLKSEGTFTAIVLETPTSNVIRYVVDVFIIAPTFSRLPHIYECGNANETCFQTLTQNTEITCIIQDARPAIPLSWMVRTDDGDRNVSSTLSITNRTHQFFTSHVTTAVFFKFSSFLTLLVCKADSPSGLLEKNESLILIQNADEALTSVPSVAKYVQTGGRLELNCTDSTFLYLTWQVNKSLDASFSNILFALFVGGNLQSHIEDHDYSLNSAGFLVIDDVGIQREGIYRCVSSNGIQDDVSIYNVVVFVLPDPTHLVVDGCDGQQYCVLDVEPKGTLTCAVKGIRPLVELDFIVSDDQLSKTVHLYDRRLTTKPNGDVLDISLILKYRLIDASKTRISIECKMIGADIKQFDLTTKLDIVFSSKNTTSTEGGNKEISGNRHYWIIALVLALLVLIILEACRKTIRKARSNMSSATFCSSTPDLGEGIPLLTLPELTELFISELKAKYQNLYDAVQPIPSIPDRLYCVDRVFVEGGIECFVTPEKTGGKGTWEKLDSYCSILWDPRVKSPRRILEGSPGYGKSTLTLQLAYDWCNPTPSTYLQSTKILILLSLRHLGGVKSIYRAIRQFLLQKDTVLTDNVIKTILLISSSVMLVLDGFDEYPDKDNDEKSDIMSIIVREMFQQFDVILTTRSSYLPKEYPALTKRLRLTGFDDIARDKYIHKAVVGDDIEAAEKVKERLRHNPIVRDMCQVPIYFVMFAHLSHERILNFQTFKSVTTSFRYIISCLQSHMENKVAHDKFEIENKELNKLAFVGLRGKAQQVVWSKKYMCEKLGKEFYDWYVRIGVLVEEEIVNIAEDPDMKSFTKSNCKPEVRFCHKLFSEWYAAHYLSQYASRDDVTFHLCDKSGKWETLDVSEQYVPNEDSKNDVQFINHPKNTAEYKYNFQDFEPNDFQYLYRFACGLNQTAAQAIIEYLKTKDGADKLIVLCVLEQNGRVEDKMQVVKDFCAKDTTIHKSYSLLLQSSTSQLLEIASVNKIPISSLNLRECYKAVKVTGDIFIQLKSSLFLPVLTTLNKLTIEERGREMTSDEILDILRYSSISVGLEKLWFWECLLPQSIHVEAFTTLRSRHFKVIWYPYISSVAPPIFELDLETGLWKHGGAAMTDKEYEKAVREVRSFRQ